MSATLTGLLILTTVLSSGTYGQVATTTCSDDTIDSCWLPLNAYMASQDLENSTLTLIDLTHLSNEQLTQFCSVWDTSTSLCIEGLVNNGNCSDNYLLRLRGSHAAFDFLCKSQDRFNALKDCLIRTIYDLVICNYVFENEVYDAGFTLHESIYNKGVCNAVGNVIECDGRAVDTVCDTDAGDWMREYESRYLSPYYDHMHGCRDNGSCTYQNIEKCWSPVNDYLNSLGLGDITTLDFLFHSLSNVQLGQFCVKYDSSTMQCLRELNSTCEEYERKNFEGDEAALDFMCNQGHQEFIQHRTCYNTSAVSSGIYSCYVQFQRDLDDAYTKQAIEELELAYCKSIKDIIACDKQVATENCGDFAGEWMEEYETRQLLPYLDGVTCAEAPAIKCTQNSINACWQPLNNYATSISYSYEHLAPIHNSDEQVRQYCSIYVDKVSDCLHNIRPFCNANDIKSFEGNEDALDYMCTKTLDEFLSHKSCIASDKVQMEITICTNQFNSDVNKTDSLTHKQMCTIVKTVVECDADGVSKQCGTAAGNWYRTYKAHILEPYLDSSGCTLFSNSGGLSSGEKAAIAIFVIISIGLIIVAVIFGLHWYKQRKAKAAMAHQAVQFNNPLTNPSEVTAGYNSEAAGYFQEETKVVPPDNMDAETGNVYLQFSNPSNDANETPHVYQDLNLQLQNDKETQPTSVSNEMYGVNSISGDLSVTDTGGLGAIRQQHQNNTDNMAREPEYANIEAGGDLASSSVY